MACRRSRGRCCICASSTVYPAQNVRPGSASPPACSRSGSPGRLARRAARGVGLISGALAPRGQLQRLARLTQPLARGVAATAAVTAVAGVAGQVAFSAAPPEHVYTVSMQHVVAVTRAQWDTPGDSLIFDAVRLPGGVVLMLGEGGRCMCGIVFTSRDAALTWSAISGPPTVTASDRFVVTPAQSGLDVHVLQNGRAAFSSPQLSAITSAGGDVVVPRASRDGWVLDLGAHRTLSVTSDHRLHLTSSAAGGNGARPGL